MKTILKKFAQGFLFFAFFFSFNINLKAQFGETLNFDGTNDYVQISSFTLGSNWTAEAWVRPTFASSGTWNVVMSQSYWNNDQGFVIAVSNGSLSFNTPGVSGINLSTTIPNNVFTHVAVSYNAGVFAFYKNGILIASQVSTYSNSTNPFYLGTRTDNTNSGLVDYFEGDIDEVRIWSTTRTQCEIQSYRNCEIPTTSAGLVSNYHFNQGNFLGANGSITTLNDAAGSNSGALNNFGLAILTSNSNWTSPGCPAQGFSTPTIPSPEINITGNSVSIVDGDITPSITDHTNFNGVATRTFVIESTGTQTLNVGVPYFTGTNASEFSITVNPNAVLAASTGSTNFVVAFTPTSLGVKTATINILSNDCSEPIYDFVITATAVAGAALNFDGVDDVVTMGDPNFGTSDCTIETWFKQTSSLTGGYLVTSRSVEGGPNGNWWGVGIGSGLNVGSATFELADAGLGYRAINSPSGMFALNTWNHLAVVRSGTIVTIYLNGLVILSTTEAGIRNFNTGNNTMHIGGWPEWNGGWYTGSVDEMRLWSVARSQCEIQTYMNTEITNTVTGLVANYHFNEGLVSSNNSGYTNLPDFSGSSNTGTLTSFALTGTVSTWVTPGAVPSGVSNPSIPTASIIILGNSNTITPGSVSTSTTNFTDFTSLSTRTFVIQNVGGTGTLSINSPITISGGAASDFSVTTQASSSITVGSSNFVINFSPIALGTRTAIVNVNSSDCAFPNYSFVISASATPASALNFDGSNDKVTIPAGITLNNQSFTVEFWSKRTSTLTGYVAGQGSSISTNQSLHIGYRPGNVFTFAFYANDMNYTTTATTDGNYHHWACVYNASAVGQNRFIYLDGVLVSSDYSNSPFLATGPFIIGDAGYGINPLDATVDELRVWGVARTQCEIQTFMNCEIPTTATGLIANYHFNQGLPSGANSTYTTLIDATGNHNGTLGTFALNGNFSNWVSPGGVVSDYTTTVAPTASISLSGNSNPILNNSVATSTLNFTNFGTTTTRTFVVQNSNTGTLNISVPYFSGVNASEFSVTVLPTLSLSASATTSFVVAFTPTASGARTATININDNDCSIPLFNFTIEGTPPPASALSFDGTNDYIDLGNTTNLKPTAGLTAETWAYMANWTVGAPTFVGNTEASGYALYSNGTDLRLIVRRNGAYAIVATPLSSISSGWHHIAGTFDGRYTKLYLDGILKDSDDAGATYSLSYIGNNTLIGAEVGFGSTPTGNYLAGQMDEVRIWSVARTQCEIQSYMNCEITSTASGLVGNYHFNQGAADIDNTGVTTLTDAAGANTGTLTNFSLLTGTVSNWVSPGGVVSGFTTAVVPTASISITGNGNAIAAGSTVPNLTNFTDFGTLNTRTFVVQSTGGGTMYINAPVTLSGANASEFSVTSQPSSSITTGTTNFVVAFTPTALGTRTAIVNVNSSDCTSPNYSFVITASATAGEALNFDGLNDVVNTPVFNTLTNNITLQAKVFWNGGSTNQMVVYNGTSSNNGYGIYLGAAGTPSILFGGIGYYTGNYTLTPNVWTSLTAVLKGGTGEFYVNGTLTNSFSIVVPNTPNVSFNIGCNSAGAEVFNGSIDEVLLWNRVLTQCEIQAYLNCEIATSASSLVANYHFNQGIAGGLNTTVTTLTDASGNNNNLTLTNFGLNGLSSNWTGQGAVTSGSSCPAYVEPDINVISNALTIPDGNTVVATSNNTDFSNITTTSVTVKSYTIQNTGNGPLTVSSITMSGADASQFVVSALTPASPISASSSAVFSVTFAPTSVGTKTATLNITNNDCDEANYDFVLSGSANVGAAISLDGTNDFINLGNILTPSYTKEAWIKLSSSINGNNILSSGSGTIGTAIWAPGSSNPLLSAGHDLNWNAVQDLNPLVLGTWYHVAVTYDAASKMMTLYKDGSVVASNTILPFSGSDPLSIGAFSGTFVTNGSFDEVRVWNRPLCQAEIVNNMNCEIPTTAPGLIANYHFNQGVGYGANSTTTLLTDVSGSANTGTLVNFAGTGTVSNWIPFSTVTTGSSCATYFAPEINVVGNGITINDGASTASISNHTDFGGVCVNGQVVRTFTIQNTGNANLSVSSISVGGVSASLSSIGPLTPSSTILPNNSAVFSVTFAPTSSGVKTTTLYISNDDCNESIYDFVMTGTCNPLPIVTASATSSVVCNGFSTILNGGGADTYTWTGGTPSVTNGVSFTPTSTLTYTVIGTNTLTGCTSTNTAVQTITVNSNPTITAAASNTVICDGSSITITPTGANSYTLNPGAIGGVIFTLSPSANISYSVTGTGTNGCVATNTAVISVIVNPLPTVTATASNSVICNTATTSLIGGGANTYTWTGGVLNNVSFTPSVTTSYTVSGTNTLTGCTSTNSAVQTITVDAIPTVSATTVSSVICDGNSATLTASGASAYTWNPGNVTTAVFNPTPSVFTTYTVIGTSSAGCTSTNTAVQSISVNALPSVTANISNSIICEGETITLTGSGASTYTWTGGAVDGVAFSPLTTSSFTLSGTNTAGCTSTNNAITSVTLNSLPSLTITSTKSAICIGDQTTLNGSGALTYTYSNGINNNVAFTPSSTASYTLRGTDANACENSAVITITVNNLPILTVLSSTNTSCEAQTVTLTVSGASSYTWSTVETTNSIVVTPIVNSTYTINAIDVNTCTNTTVYTQSVIPCPGTFTASVSKTDISCNGKDDGIIAISSFNSYNSSNLSYSWTPSTLCANNTCDSLKNLKAGTYSLTLILTYTINGTLVKMDTLVLDPITLVDLNGQCVVKVYSGISANNDGINDVLTIENIEEFPNNTVTVFNRWGQQVYQVKGYNNLDKAWPMNGEETKFSSNTFFYIIDLGTGDKLMKGWIELIKN